DAPRSRPAGPKSAATSTAGTMSRFYTATACRRARGTSGRAGGTPGHGLQRLEASGRRQFLAAGLRIPQGVAPRDERALREMLERARLGEQEPLPGHAAEREESGDLRLVLDALGHRLEPERLAEGDDGARELRPIVAVGQAADEGAVDLEDV